MGFLADDGVAIRQRMEEIAAEKAKARAVTNANVIDGSQGTASGVKIDQPASPVVSNGGYYYS
jgi:hypothetical protein